MRLAGCETILLAEDGATAARTEVADFASMISVRMRIEAINRGFDTISFLL